MTILDEIIAHKRKEIAERQSLKPIKLLERSIYFETPVVPLTQYLQRKDKVGIIAEIKRASPSKGTINEHVDVEQLSIAYMQSGASALSVLTDTKYFSGSTEDLTIARKNNYCPILCKDFMVSEYQLIEAKSMGADCILLIAAALPVKTVKELALFARNLDLEVLLEVHDESELKKYAMPEVDLVGVNNRNLKDFTVSLERSLSLIDAIPDEFVKISESGIRSAEELLTLKEKGFQGFLLGGHFMEHFRPEEECRKLVEAVEMALA